ncbi:MAG: DNA/RNA non-specific endonuclease [Gammaproteobacteria bacterium]|nr:DNA/RNA non-specific endonuclease [Gammaproteobacteria bacterium]MDD9895602.1 DNA/RNA non-specific endonuclease [Gammaproteobacteria bacterium]MDD9958991.1 DNA/RNA non-specific endonuclease [Gammaproteobacteria bacterium]
MKFISNSGFRWFTVTSLTFFLWTSSGQNIHISHCLAGCPAGSATDSEIVVRHLYVAELNTGNGLADWVAYRVLPDSIGVASLLPRWWQQDELLSSASVLETNLNQPLFAQPDLSDAQDRDYRVNEVIFTAEDRGRLAPITSFADTPFWEELNNLSNMTPLPGDLRSGAWSRLEQAINELAAEVGQLYVISGPLYEVSGRLSTSARSGSLPSSFFKVVATKTDYAAFLFSDDLPIHADYCEHIAPVNAIQESSGFALFPELRDELSPGLFSGLRCQFP